MVRAVVLNVFEEAERCVLTTHPQFDLPKDLRILRAITVHNRTQMGIYAGVAREGVIRVGDCVRLQSDSPTAATAAS